MQGLPTRVNLTPVKFNLLSSQSPRSPRSIPPSLRLVFRLVSVVLDAPPLPPPPPPRAIVTVTFDTHQGIRAKRDIDRLPDFNYHVGT